MTKYSKKEIQFLVALINAKGDCKKVVLKDVPICNAFHCPVYRDYCKDKNVVQELATIIINKLSEEELFEAML